MRALGLLSSGFGPKKPWHPQCPLFSRLKVDTSSGGKNTALLDLEWRKMKGLGESFYGSIERVFGYKARVNGKFLNTSRLLEVTKREHNEPLLSVKNLQELGSSPFPYIAHVIPCLLPGEVVGGEYFVFVDFLNEVNLG